MAPIKIWEYDPTDLDEDQLTFELMIRGITHYKERRAKTKALRQQLMNERHGQDTYINVENLDPDFEIKTCKEAAIDLTTRMGKVFSAQDRGQFNRLSSQAAFYYNRLNLVADRENPKFLEALSCFNSIEEMLKDARRNKRDKAQQQIRSNSPILNNLGRTQGLPTAEEMMRRNVTMNDQLGLTIGRGRVIPQRANGNDESITTIPQDNLNSSRNVETRTTGTIPKTNSRPTLNQNDRFSTEDEQLVNLFNKSMGNGLNEQIHHIETVENVPKNQDLAQNSDQRQNQVRLQYTNQNLQHPDFANIRYREQNQNQQHYNKRANLAQQQLPEMYDERLDVRANDRQNVDYRHQLPQYQTRDQYPYPEENMRANQQYSNPVKRWNFVFSGDGQGFSLSDFFSRIELNARAERVTNDQLFLSFHYLLSGEAEKWYRGNYREFRDWHDLVVGMRRHFLPRNYNHLLRDEIANRQQGRQESFAHFITDMKILFQRAFPPLDEDYKIYVVQKNMLPQYSANLVCVNFVSLNQLVDYCKRLDENKLMSERRAISVQYGQSSLMEPACFPKQQPFREGFRPDNQNRPFNQNRNFMRVAEIGQVEQQNNYENYNTYSYNPEQHLHPSYIYGQLGHPQQDYYPNTYDTNPNHYNIPTLEYNQTFPNSQPHSTYPQHIPHTQIRGNYSTYTQNINTNSRHVPINSCHDVSPIDYTKSKCWNCDEIGHGFQGCRKQRLRIFCFQCGAIGQTTKSCSHQNVRNFRERRETPMIGPTQPQRSGNEKTDCQRETRAFP